MTGIKEVIINIRLLSSETVGQLCLQIYFFHITWKILEFCNLYIIHSLDSKNAGLALCNYNWLVLRNQLRWQTSTISLSWYIFFISRRLKCCNFFYQKFRLSLHDLFFKDIRSFKRFILFKILFWHQVIWCIGYFGRDGLGFVLFCFI